MAVARTAPPVPANPEAKPESAALMLIDLVVGLTFNLCPVSAYRVNPIRLAAMTILKIS